MTPLIWEDYMKDEEIIAIIETLGVTREIAEEALKNCGKDVEQIRRYILNLPTERESISCKCIYCGRTLKDPNSIKRGYGEECYKKYLKKFYNNIFE